MKTTLALFLCLALAQCGLPPAWADAVAVPDTPPAIEEGGPDASDLAASAPIGTDLAMLYHVPATGNADLSPAASSALPVELSAGTGADTRLGVDMSALNSQAEREGWPTWAKGTVIVCGVAVVALASWAIVEACQHGEHTSGDDSSSHFSVGVGGENNSVTIHYDSPQNTSTQSGGSM